VSSATSNDSGFSKKPIVLVVDDNLSTLDQIKQSFLQEFSVYTSTEESDAYELINGLPRVDILVVAECLPRMQGVQFLHIVDEVVGYSDEMIKVLIARFPRTDKLNASDYSSKIEHFYSDPFDSDDLRRRINYLKAYRSKEKRSSMRVKVAQNKSASVEIIFKGKGQIENISENGMYIITAASFLEGDILPFNIIFPDGEQCLLSGRVARVNEKQEGIGVEFKSVDERCRNAISQFMFDHVISYDLSDLQKRYPFLRIDEMVGFTDTAEIAHYFQKARESQTEFTAIHSQSRTPVTLELFDMKHGEHCTLAGENLDIKFKTSDAIFVSFQVGYATYNFETAICRITPDGDRIKCVYPKIMFYSEKRALKREEVMGTLDLEISLPPPFNKTVKGIIADISDDGVSFIADSNTPPLLVGTPLDSILILKEQKIVREERGEVRNVAVAGGDSPGQLRFGIQFGIGRRIIRAPEISGVDPCKKKNDTQAENTDLVEPESIFGLNRLAQRPPDVIHLENGRGEDIIGLINTSLPLDSTSVPTVLIPPAFGKTKETLFALALTIITNFFIRKQPVVVIRYDGIRRKGESYKDPEASEPPNEMINACISQGAEDIKTVLDWIEANPRFSASSVSLVTFSLSALEARLILRERMYRSKVDYWVSCMGTPELRHLLTRVNCGLDLLEQHQLGIELGVMPVLGNLVNVNKYMEDGLKNRIATLNQAREDMKDIDIPVTWIYGEHDHWVKPEFVRDIMGINANADREVMTIPLGHSARTSLEALKMFGTVTSLLYSKIHKDLIQPVIPKKGDLYFMRRAEKDRIPSRNLKNREQYWHRYLVGEDEQLGFDVLLLADEYQQLLHDQMLALDLGPDDHFLDLGGGTGNFVSHFLNADIALPRQISIADLIPEALEQARYKLDSKINKATEECIFDTYICDLELNRYLPVSRFISGEFAGFGELVDKVEHLTARAAAKIEKEYSPRLHRILRGGKVTPALEGWLKRTFDLPEYRIILDFNRAARYVRNLGDGTVVYRELVFSEDFEQKRQLPIEAGRYNKILMSLVLSYIFNPLETLIELRRIIQPGGLLVVSSLHPDADASGLFTHLVEKVESMPENDFPEGWEKQLVIKSIRSFLNDAQALVELEEAGTFDFFEQESLERLLEEAGFDCVRRIETFGDPPQGYILVAKAEEENG
jgi:ubiquinone/menaquinone biosynthesis C-methylase UbiE/CheY-like chemotaxis protein